MPTKHTNHAPQLLVSTGANSSDFEYARRQIYLVCQMAGSPELIDEAQASIRRDRVPTAIRTRNTPLLFNYLVNTFSYQGVSDAAADSYLKQHGGVTWHEIEMQLGKSPPCIKLRNYWQFHRCDYQKTNRTCSVPAELLDCPLPSHRLRNGRLNQMAYSLFLFIRDIADNDLVGWIDRQIGAVPNKSGTPDFAELGWCLVRPMREIFGVSDKVVNMALSDLLLAGGPGKPGWRQIGASMIVIDTLVHNFLHRTGILHRFGSRHVFGEACYRPKGCAEIIRAIADKIDARTFNSSFPAVFPRFVQKAIWQYCAQAGLNVCNGNQINDRRRCENVFCRLFDSCERHLLRNQPKHAINVDK